MVVKTITFTMLLSRYPSVKVSGNWAVAQQQLNPELYDIYYSERDRYEYLASSPMRTENPVILAIFDEF